MKTKNILIASGAIVAVAAWWGYNKIQKLKAVFEQMTVLPSGISGINITLAAIRFKLNFTINNPTAEDFSITTGKMAAIKRIIVYRKGKLLGVAQVDIDNIEIPAYAAIEIKDIELQVAVSSLLDNIMTIQGISLDEITIACVVSVIGKEFTIIN